MTPAAFKSALSALGLSNAQAAAWLGVSVRSIQVWSQEGGKGPPLCVVRLVELVQGLRDARFYADDGKPYMTVLVAWSDIEPLIEMERG